MQIFTGVLFAVFSKHFVGIQVVSKFWSTLRMEITFRQKQLFQTAASVKRCKQLWFMWDEE